MQTSKLTLYDAVEWRKPIWAKAVQNVFDRASSQLPAGSQILEIGFFSGKMSCYMAQNYDWEITAYDIDPKQQAIAQQYAHQYQQQHKTDFRVVHPQETLKIQGEYDAIFLKSVLYHLTDLESYRSWLQWLHQRLRPGGVLMAVENARGHWLDQQIRKRLNWGQNLLFSNSLRDEFENIFQHVDIQYFGFVSQYLTACTPLCELALKWESRLLSQRAHKSFIASILAQKSS